MPATRLICHERSGLIAAAIRPILTTIPAVLRESRSAADLQAALEASRYPVAILAFDANETATLADEVARYAGTSVVVGNRLSANELMEVREAGVAAILPPGYPEEKLRLFVERLVQQSQRQLQQSAGTI